MRPPSFRRFTRLGARAEPIEPVEIGTGWAPLPARRWAVGALPRWAALLFVAVLARALTFGNPILHVDEQFYFVTAQGMLDGAVPYVDIWDRKPIGLFLLYLPAAALGYPLGIGAYQIMALGCVVVTALLIARLTERAGAARGALPAAIAYILWLDLLEGQGGQSPVFYNLLMVGAAWFVAPRPDDAAHPARRFRDGLVAMALVGLALQVKYSVVFEGMFFGLWWLWRELRLGAGRAATLQRGAVLAATALVPTMLVWGAYTVAGMGDAFVFANFLSIARRQADPLLEQFGNLALLSAFLAPLIAIALLGRDTPRPDAGSRAMHHWLLCWAAASLGGILLAGTWFDHYGLPALVPLAACAASFLSLHPFGRRIALPMLLVVFAGGQALLVQKQLSRGTASEFGAVVSAVEPGAGCLYVGARDTMLYAATDRCRVTRYVFPSHLARRREQGAIGVDQATEMRRVLASGPEIVVMRKPYRGERRDIRTLIERYLRGHYRLTETLPLGSDTIRVYRRR